MNPTVPIPLRYSDGPSLRQASFLLTGDVTFAPFYVPDRIRQGKDRNLNRVGGFCGGEDVTDLGSKNREIHVHGRILESERSAFDACLDHNQPFDMVTGGWSGEVRVLGGEYEGPTGFDPIQRERFFMYSIDLLSTGKDEYPTHGDSGIIAP